VNIKEFGIKVKIVGDDSLGYIVRRLDASAYEIMTEDGVTVILSPQQFKEIKNEC
jgi:hypothetical protein